MIVNKLLQQLKYREVGVIILACQFAASSSSIAAQLNFGDNSEVSGTIDTTLSYGASFRAEDSDAADLVPGFANLGLNYASEARVPDKGDLVSNVISVLGEIGIDYRNYGLSASVSYQYDNEIMNGDAADRLTGEKADWTDAAEDYAGSAINVSDAYVYGTFDVGENPLELRLGKQVINWGEGLFFFDGGAQQVPLNINKLTTPGSELKDAYVGVESLYGQLGVGDSASLEAYVHFNWRRTEFPPTGTFFGSDAFFRGGTEDVESSPEIFGIGIPARDRDIEPSESGQFGLAYRAFVGGDTEIGAYYSRYHETFPFIVFNEADGSSLFEASQYWPEDLDMYALSVSTTLGDWSFNSELAYRPDRPLFTFLGVTDEKGQGEEKHDSWHLSSHGIWLGGPTILGIDNQVALAQIGVDYIDGDTDNLAPNSSITRDAPGVASTQTADSTAYGLAVEWAGTWNNAVGNGNHLTLDIFLQKDISGNSHFWGNFAEDRLLGAVTLSASIGNDMETGLSYSFTEQEKSDYEDGDLLVFNFNYKF